MAITRTTNVGLQKPDLNERNWHTPLNANADAIDAYAPIGTLAVRPVEFPSTTLNVRVSAGSYQKVDGTIGTYAGTSSHALTGSATNYLFLTDAGTLTVNTTGFPTTNHVRLATVVCGTSTVTSVADSRVTCETTGNRALTALTAANAGSTASYSQTITDNMRTRINEIEARLKTLGLLPP